MELINKVIKINGKSFPTRIHEGKNPEYIFVTHHGILSNKTSWRYLEKYLGEDAIVINFDARVNGDNQLRASRLMGTYTRDLRDVVRWAKKEYPNIKIITIGSSWGATVVIDHAKKYGKEVFKSVAWSVPYRFTQNEEKPAIKNVEAEVKELKTEKTNSIKETSISGYIWRIILMLVFNINTKSYTKIDLNKTANNKTLARINRMNKPKATPVKLFWATYKGISNSNKSMIKINKRNEKSELLYFQSTIDGYLIPKKLEQIKRHCSNGLKLNILNEGKHAFQWETENKLNERVFEMMMRWLKTRS